MFEEIVPEITQAPVVPTPQVPPAPAAGEPQFTDREKQYYERIKKLEGEIALTKPQTPPVPPASTPAPADFDTLAAFVEATRDLKTVELSELRTEAKNLGIDPMKYISSKSGQAHLKEIRQVAASAAGTPSPSTAVRTFGGKPLKEVFTDPSVSKETQQAAWADRTRGGKGGTSSV